MCLRVEQQEPMRRRNIPDHTRQRVSIRPIFKYWAANCFSRRLALLWSLITWCEFFELLGNVGRVPLKAGTLRRCLPKGIVFTMTRRAVLIRSISIYYGTSRVNSGWNLFTVMCYPIQVQSSTTPVLCGIFQTYREISPGQTKFSQVHYFFVLTARDRLSFNLRSRI